MATTGKMTKHYPSDLRNAANAIRYLVGSGFDWRVLAIHFPPWRTVCWWSRRFVRLLLFRTIHDLVVIYAAMGSLLLCSITPRANLKRLLPTVIVLNANDVVLAEILARLDLDEIEGDVPGFSSRCTEPTGT